MAELVEGARLEIVYTRNSIKGSNPFLSATKKPAEHGVPQAFSFVLPRRLASAVKLIARRPVSSSQR